MPISNRLKTKIRLTMLYLSVFELYSRWVPLNPQPDLAGIEYWSNYERLYFYRK